MGFWNTAGDYLIKGGKVAGKVGLFVAQSALEEVMSNLKGNRSTYIEKGGDSRRIDDAIRSSQRSSDSLSKLSDKLEKSNNKN